MVLCSANAPAFSNEVLREENQTALENADKITYKTNPIDPLTDRKTIKTIYVNKKE